MIRQTLGDQNAIWIQKYCQRHGKPIVLTVAEIVLIRRIYDEGERPQLDAVLSACVVLLHLCGIEATPVGDSTLPAHISADVFSLWNAAGPRLRQYIRREGEVVACPQLGTRYPAIAA
jgi:hypothetical protein